MLTIMSPMFLSVLSYDVHILFLSLWLDMRNLAILDIAFSNNGSRPYWMTLLHSLRSCIIDDWGHNMSSLMWLIRRGIHARRVQMKEDAWLVRGCDLLLLETADIEHFGLSGCSELTDQCIMNMVNVCGKLTSIDLNECNKLTDTGISPLGARCGQLKSINIAGCGKVTDAGISALGAGCGQLQSINLWGCDKVTDVGRSALGAGCQYL